MEQIKIDVGMNTPIEVDLLQFDFTGITKLIMTFKNRIKNETVCTREFTTAAKHTITITPTESEKMAEDCEYDFIIVTTDGDCYKNGDNGFVKLRWGCGECPKESE